MESPLLTARHDEDNPRAGDAGPARHAVVSPEHAPSPPASRRGQDLRVFGGVAPGEQGQPPEEPDHEQVDETDDHEDRA
jgi:hypothetical protein